MREDSKENGRALRGLVKLVGGWLALRTVRPVRDAWRTLRGRHPVRVFTFHRITDQCRDGMTVTPATFRRRVEYIRRHHDVVSLDRALELLARGTPLRRPVAVLTFDDAYRSVYDEARPVLAALGLPGCCFVTTEVVGPGARFAHDAAGPDGAHLAVMDWPELRRLRDDGWQLGAHGASHRRMAECVGPELWREVHEPLRALRARADVERPPVAYPFGGVDDLSAEGRALIRASGARACFADYGGENLPGDDPFALKRIDIGGDHPTVVWKCWANGMAFGRWRRRARASARAVSRGVTGRLAKGSGVAKRSELRQPAEPAPRT